MYKQEHQQSDNKFFRGLWTPNSFLHRSHGRCSPCRFYCYSQLMLNNRQLLILNVALVWRMNVQIAMHKVCTCRYTVQIGSYRACRACKMHESLVVKSAFFKSADRLKNKKVLKLQFTAYSFVCEPLSLRTYSDLLLFCTKLQFNQVECECGGLYQ